MSDYRPSRFVLLPQVVKNLLILNGLAYLATMVFGQERLMLSPHEAIMVPTLIKKFGLFQIESDYFRPLQFITHMFLHGGFLHIFSNMFALWMFGTALENVWGPKRFLIFYFVCGFGAAILHSAVTFIEIHYLMDPAEGAMMLNIPTVGASGAVFGVLIAFGMLFPNTQLMLLFPPIPIRAKYFVIFYAAFELFAGFNSLRGPGEGMNIAHFAHIGGMIFGFFLVKYWNRRRTNFW